MNKKMSKTMGGWINAKKLSACLLAACTTVTVAPLATSISVNAEEAQSESVTVVKDATTGKWHAVDKNGNVVKNVKFAKNQYGTWVINENGEVVFSANGLLKDTYGDISSDKSKIYYVESGKVCTDKTGFVGHQQGSIGNASKREHETSKGKLDGATVIDDTESGYYYVENGIVTGKTFENSVIKDTRDGKWLNVQANGKVGGNGLAKNENGVWVIKDGIVQFNADGFYSYINNPYDKSIYYVKNGKIQTEYTGWAMYDYTGDGKLNRHNDDINYVVDGKVSNPAKTSVEKAPDGNWYYADANSPDGNGTNWNYIGIAENQNGKWYCWRGEVSFGTTGIKCIDNTEDWYYFVNGKLQEGKTDIAQKDSSWYYVGEDGKVDFTKDTVAQNKYGWWVVRDGYVSFIYNGIASNENGDWYCENSKVRFDVTGVVKSEAKETEGWYYVKNGRVQKGEVTVQKNNNGWWYIGKDGKVDFTYYGLASNEYGTWVIEKGKVNFAYNDKYTDEEGYDYEVVNGKVVSSVK